MSRTVGKQICLFLGMLRASDGSSINGFSATDGKKNDAIRRIRTEDSAKSSLTTAYAGEYLQSLRAAILTEVYPSYVIPRL